MCLVQQQTNCKKYQGNIQFQIVIYFGFNLRFIIKQKAIRQIMTFFGCLLKANDYLLFIVLPNTKNIIYNQFQLYILQQFTEERMQTSQIQLSKPINNNFNLFRLANPKFSINFSVQKFKKSVNSTLKYKQSDRQQQQIKFIRTFKDKAKIKVIPSLFIQQRLKQNYIQSENYFYSKDINDQISHNHTQHFIKMKEYYCYDNPGLCLKRFYKLQEYTIKINFITEYYKFHNEIVRLFMLPISKQLNEYYDTKRRVDYVKITKLIQLEQEQKKPRLRIQQLEQELKVQEQTRQSKPKEPQMMLLQSLLQNTELTSLQSEGQDSNTNFINISNTMQELKHELNDLNSFSRSNLCETPSRLSISNSGGNISTSSITFKRFLFQLPTISNYQQYNEHAQNVVGSLFMKKQKLEFKASVQGNNSNSKLPPQYQQKIELNQYISAAKNHNQQDFQTLKQVPANQAYPFAIQNKNIQNVQVLEYSQQKPRKTSEKEIINSCQRIFLQKKTNSSASRQNSAPIVSSQTFNKQFQPQQNYFQNYEQTYQQILYNNQPYFERDSFAISGLKQLQPQTEIKSNKNNVQKIYLNTNNIKKQIRPNINCSQQKKLTLFQTNTNSQSHSNFNSIQIGESNTKLKQQIDKPFNQNNAPYQSYALTNTEYKQQTASTSQLLVNNQLSLRYFYFVINFYLESNNHKSFKTKILIIIVRLLLSFKKKNRLCISPYNNQINVAGLLYNSLYLNCTVNHNLSLKLQIIFITLIIIIKISFEIIIKPLQKRIKKILRINQIRENSIINFQGNPFQTNKGMYFRVSPMKIQIHSLIKIAIYCQQIRAKNNIQKNKIDLVKIIINNQNKSDQTFQVILSYPYILFMVI